VTPTILAFEHATLAAWPPLARAERNGWVLQAGEGQSRRINTAWPLAWDGAVPLAQAIDEAEAWMRARNIPPAFKIVEGFVAPPELPDALTARGYRPTVPTLLMTRALQAGQINPDVLILSEPDEACFAPMRADAIGPDYRERRDALLRAPHPRGFATIREGGATLAMGACIVTGDIASIFVMRTARQAQRRGLAHRILSALQTWAHGQGARAICLQVEEENPPAVALYEKAGFARAYRYHHWVAG
jgi:ribosomal protein S18 acetylase RimI-like enzyme